MCGIVGLLLKKPQMREQLGRLALPMLIGMTERGPDSRDVDLDRLDGAIGRLVRPETIDDRLDRDGATSLDDQQRQHRPRSPATDVDRHPVAEK